MNLPTTPAPGMKTPTEELIDGLVLSKKMGPMTMVMATIEQVESALLDIERQRARAETAQFNAARAEEELSGERNLHGQTRVVVEDLNSICNDLRATLTAAEARCAALEASLKELIPYAEIGLDVDPVGDANEACSVNMGNGALDQARFLLAARQPDTGGTKP